MLSHPAARAGVHGLAAAALLLAAAIAPAQVFKDQAVLGLAMAAMTGNDGPRR